MFMIEIETQNGTTNIFTSHIEAMWYDIQDRRTKISMQSGKVYVINNTKEEIIDKIKEAYYINEHEI